MRETCGIYKITNTKNDKVYIGSSKNILNRWGNHIFNLVGGKHHSNEFQKDFEKYGVENFIFQVLKILDNKENLLIEEQHYINLYNSNNPKLGYNKSNPVLNFEESLLKNEIHDDFSNMNIFNIEYNFSKKYNRQNFNFMSFNWFKSANSKNLKDVRGSLYNISRNYFKNYNSKDIVWTTFLQYKENLHTRGIVKQYNYLYNSEIDKTNKLLLIYANVFPNAFDMDINKDDYAKIILKEFIYNNADLNDEFFIYTPIDRMRKILEEIKYDK